MFYFPLFLIFFLQIVAATWDTLDPDNKVNIRKHLNRKGNYSGMRVKGGHKKTRHFREHVKQALPRPPPQLYLGGKKEES